jgi:RNA polymerase sigma factor for flagellar operon FliA
MRRLMARFDREDQLIVVMRFEDGRTVAEIAAVLHVDQKGLYRRFERVLRELRAGLEAEGFEAGRVMEILESPAVTIAWAAGDAESAKAVRL